MKEKLRSLIEQGERWWLKHERYVSSGTLVAGFIFDNIALKRIDLLTENLILLGYLTIAVVGIFFVNLIEGGVLLHPFFARARAWLTMPIQFALGGLFSGVFIFYSRSAALSQSWPFLVFLTAIILGNEVFRQKYLRLSFQASVLFVGVFSYVIYSLPILLHSMSVWVFLLSGLVALGFVAVLLVILARFIPEKVRENKTTLMTSVGGLFLALNVMYFLNIIPPLPLSLKEADVAHSVSKTRDGYVLEVESRSWRDWILPYTTVHRAAGQPLYFYSSVFAPTDLSAALVHEWAYQDVASGEWVASTRVPLAITGGRDGGYRGYSYKNTLAPGRWRVDVETENGQLLGRVKFVVTSVPRPPKTFTEIR